MIKYGRCATPLCAYYGANVHSQSTCSAPSIVFRACLQRRVAPIEIGRVYSQRLPRLRIYLFAKVFNFFVPFRFDPFPDLFVLFGAD